MKVLHLHFGKEGGAERFFVNLAKGLADRGVEQRFVIRPNRSWRDEIAPLGPIIENNYRYLSLSRHLTKWRVHRMVNQWQPQAIVAWMNRASQLMPAGSPAIKMTRLGDYPNSLKHFANNDCMVSNTPGIAEHCRAIGWEKPVHVISNFPREVQPKAISRASMDTPDDAFLVVSSGRFVNRKGFDTVMRAVAQIPDAWLWLVGDGQERGALENLAAELGISDRVRFCGWVDEPMHHVAAGDVYCMASRHEPLGNVVLESWQADVPTITTRCEGPSWFVEDGIDALMVDIDDHNAMADKIGDVRQNKKLAVTLVTAGRKKLNTQFSKDVIVDRYCELFKGQL